MPDLPPWTFLRKRREDADLTLERFGELIGRDASVISRWEAGEVCPRPAMFPVIARTLNCSVAELLSTVPRWAEQVAS
jgi:transcriptional regulator with XRE-family HTH domain